VTWLLVSALIASSAAAVTLAVLSRLDARALSDARVKAADAQRRFELEQAEHAATRNRLDQENKLRVIAESQRNAAEGRVRELLVAHAKDATDDEIREMVRDAFASPLSVLPAPAATAADDPDGLINPFADVQPAKTT
jgi:hypothetical protein